MTSKMFILEKGDKAYKVTYYGREMWEPENLTLKELWERYQNLQVPYEGWYIAYDADRLEY